KSKGCTPTQENMVGTSLATARDWLSTAAPEISAFAKGTGSKLLEPSLRKALKDNFHTDSPTYVKDIASNFNGLQAILSGGDHYKCYKKDSDSCKDKRMADTDFALGSTIGLCPRWFNCNLTMRATILIHEKAHQWKLKGEVYEDDSGYGTLTPAEAVENAD